MWRLLSLIACAALFMAIWPTSLNSDAFPFHSGPTLSRLASIHDRKQVSHGRERDRHLFRTRRVLQRQSSPLIKGNHGTHIHFKKQ